MKLKKQKIIKGSIQLPPRVKEVGYPNTIVEGHFSCSNTKITSLKGSPFRVDGDFGCTDVYITSYEGAPEYVSGYFFSHGTFYITSLHGIHKHIKYIGKAFNISRTVRSHVLGVMFIKGLQELVFVDGDREQWKVMSIINKHFKGSRNIHDVQEELLEAGLREYARI